MAKKKELKKSINMMSADLMRELLAAEQASTKVQHQDIENIAQSILLMRADFVSRLSHVDKRQVRPFFRVLEDDLSVATNEIVDQICHIV